VQKQRTWVDQLIAVRHVGMLADLKEQLRPTGCADIVQRAIDLNLEVLYLDWIEGVIEA
jgi:hypothetical protein